MCDEAVGCGTEVLAQVAGRVEHVADVLQREIPVGQPRRDHGLGHHSDQQNALTGESASEVEEPVEQVTPEDVTGHVLGRRHPLERSVGEQSTGEHRVGELEAERVGDLRVDLERVPEPELPILEAGLLREVLVEQLAHRHGVRGVDGVCRGEVVVLTRVDDDPGTCVDLAAEPLVDECAHWVDVAEEDPVHRVVEHHVESLEACERGNLGHAQSGRVVRESHIAAELAAGLVECSTHETEVLLGGVRSGVPLARGPLGHVVEQRLPGRPDHGDHVGTFACRRLRLRDVLVDVAGGDDQVDPGSWGVAVLRDELVAGTPVGVDASNARGDLRPSGLTCPCRIARFRDAEGEGSGCGLLRNRQEVVVGRQHRVPHRQGHTVFEAYLFAYDVDQAVDPRDPLDVSALQAGKAQDGALDRHRRVSCGQRDDRGAGLARQRAGFADGDRIEFKHATRVGMTHDSNSLIEGTAVFTDGLRAEAVRYRGWSHPEPRAADRRQVPRDQG